MNRKYKGFNIDYYDNKEFYGKVTYWEISNDWLRLESGEFEGSKKDFMIEMKLKIDEYWEENKTITDEAIELTKQVLEQLESKDIRKIKDLASNLDSTLQYGFQQGFWK